MDQELAAQLLAQMTELQTAVEESGSPWSDLGPPLITGILVFLAALIPTIWQERGRVKHQTKTLRASLIAEISALAEIIRSRRYLEDLRAGVDGERQTLTVNVPGDYFRVYKANLDKLGLLEPDEASRIVRLYQLIESVIQDVTPGGVLYTGEGGQKAFQQDLAFMERALELADHLVAEQSADRKPLLKKLLSVFKK